MADLNPGDRAPDFKAKNQNNDTVRLSDFAGHQLFVYFYPKADTSG